MDTFIYRAALYCPHCAEQIKTHIRETDSGSIRAGANDSDTWPQGPYSNGGGEADTPQHCDTCGVFLENPLTRDGENYVREAMDNSGDKETRETWRAFYSYLF